MVLLFNSNRTCLRKPKSMHTENEIFVSKQRRKQRKRKQNYNKNDIRDMRHIYVYGLYVMMVAFVALSRKTNEKTGNFPYTCPLSWRRYREHTTRSDFEKKIRLIRHPAQTYIIRICAEVLTYTAHIATETTTTVYINI